MAKHSLLLLLLMTSTIVMSQSNLSVQPRTIVTTDGEIDDVDSFIRMLLYANEYKLEGLIYSASMWHYKGDDHGTPFISEMEMTKKLYGQKTSLRWPGTQWMQGLIDAYEQVYPNLSTHDRGFPTAGYLRSLIKVGNIDFEGEMDRDTEGSDFIKAILLANDPSPVYIQVWGGTNTVARALKSIEAEYQDSNQWKTIYQKVCQKTILFTILDQDATYKKYIAPHWAGIKVMYNAHQFACLAYPWKRQVPQEMQTYLEGKFMSEQIIQGHGPLTKMYYSYGDGQKQAGDDEHIHGDPTKLKNTYWGSFEKYDFISEGDSPAFLHMVDVGLDNLDHPEYGGWGGRLIQSWVDTSRWEDGDLVAELNPYTQKPDPAYPQTRWLPALQQDFASRADWCVKKYSEANHPPQIMVHKKIISASPGKKLKLQASYSDPDKNKVQIKWWNYKEVGHSESVATLQQNNAGKALIKIPVTAVKGDTFHFIAEGTDDGVPALTRYQRVIVMVQ